MKYTAQSSKYIFKNFLYLFPLAVLPAFFLALSTDKASIDCLVETLRGGALQEMHFHHVFRAISVLNFASWPAIVAGFISMLAIVVCVALMMALIEKHFRIGKRTFNGLFSKLNDYLPSTLWYGALLLVIYELWTLITSALIFSMSRITILPLAYALIALAFLGMHVVLIYLVGIIYLWLPCMQITGFRAIEALHYSYQLLAPVKWRILAGQFAFLLFVEAVVGALAVVVGSVTFTVLTTLLYAILIMVYCVRMQIAYFDRDNIERADLRNYYGR